MQVVHDGLEGVAPPRFETLEVGQAVPGRAYSAVTVIDTVRWAGFQENYAQLHFDRDYVRNEAGLKTFIASGAFRESLMVRLITDWLGPRGRFCQLETRQMLPTLEGDSLSYSGRVVEKSDDPVNPWVKLEMEGHNQDGRQILKADCKVIVESDAGQGAKQ